MMDTSDLKDYYSPKTVSSQGTSTASSGFKPDLSGGYQLFYPGMNEIPNVGQTWWRSPDWAGGVTWNDYWGWQDPDAVRNLYRGASGPVSDEQFYGWNFTPQTEYDWRHYYPDYKTDQEWRDSGYEWDESNRQWINAPGPLYIGAGGPNTGNQGGTTMGDWDQYSDLGGFQNYPWQWGQASDVFSQFAGGLPTDVPSQWQDATTLATQMGATGMPTSWSPWYQAAKQQTQYDINDAIKQASEQAGLGGTRWSSVLGRTAQDISSRRMAELGQQWTAQELGAEEAARARQQQAVNQLYQLGSGTAGLTESAKDRGMTAAGQLGNLGSMYAQLPMTAAQTAMGLGGQMQATGQSTLDKLFGSAMRMAPENNPWLQYIYQMATGQGTPQQYTPGAGTQLLSGITSILPFLFLL